LLRGEARREKKAGQKERPVRAEDEHGQLDDIESTGFQSGLSWRAVLLTYHRSLHRLLRRAHSSPKRPHGAEGIK
jgi:hypothetical protein